MKALILAAGRGERMRPLTEHTPKPLLAAGGQRLIEWHLDKLAALGIGEVVINTSHLADQFPAALGDGSRWGLHLHYAYEGPEPLETGGGMLHALPLLGTGPFLVVNGDIWTDFDFARLPDQPRGDAHLVLVDNPPHHPQGDFVLRDDGTLDAAADAARLTFAGIGMFRPGLLDDWRTCVPQAAGEARPMFALRPLLEAGMRRAAITGMHHRGAWTDVGTPQRLAALDAALNDAPPVPNGSGQR